MKRYKKTSNPTFTKGTSIYLVIVESPSKCGKIESYLGEQYKCVSSKGRLRELDSIIFLNLSMSVISITTTTFLVYYVIQSSETFSSKSKSKSKGRVRVRVRVRVKSKSNSKE